MKKMKLEYIKPMTVAVVTVIAMATGLGAGIQSVQAQCTPDGVFCVGRQQLVAWSEGTLRLDRYTGKVAYLSGPRTMDTPTQQADRFNADKFNPVAGLHWISLERKTPAFPDQDAQLPGTVNYLLNASMQTEGTQGMQVLLLNLNTGMTWVLAPDRQTQARQWAFFPVQ